MARVSERSTAANMQLCATGRPCYRCVQSTPKAHGLSDKCQSPSGRFPAIGLPSSVRSQYARLAPANEHKGCPSFESGWHVRLVEWDLSGRTKNGATCDWTIRALPRPLWITGSDRFDGTDARLAQNRLPRKIMYRQTTDDCRSHDLTSPRSLARCFRVGARISAGRRRRATSVTEVRGVWWPRIRPSTKQECIVDVKHLCAVLSYKGASQAGDRHKGARIFGQIEADT